MEKKHQAQQLYMAGGRTQREIADTIGVSERTVHTWVHQYAWDRLRLAALQAPATIADNICAQLVELQNGIARREPGLRFPTMDEAEITRKLIASLEKMKKYPSTSQHMQVLETFRNYIRPVDKEFAKQLAGYTTRFLSSKNHNGYAPYQLEYGVSPVDPYYEEPEETGSDTADQPCKNIANCRHEVNCNYPRCLHRQTYGEPADPLVTYSIPSFHFQQPEMQYPDTPGNDIMLSEKNGSIPANEEPMPSLFIRPHITPSPFPKSARILSLPIPDNWPPTHIGTAPSGSDPATCTSEKRQKAHFNSSNSNLTSVR